MNCDCFRPVTGNSPDLDCGGQCNSCEMEILDRRCEVCKKDFDPQETEERSDGKWVCKTCYLDSLEFIN